MEYKNDLDSLYITSISFKELKFKRFRQRLHACLDVGQNV